MMRQVCNPFICLLAGLMLGGGCDRSAPKASPERAEPMHVIASVYAIGDLARQVGGKYADVAWTIESGQSLSSFSPTPELRARLSAAELIVAGGSTEPWAISNSENPFAPERILRMDALSMRVADPSQPGFVWLDPQVARSACDELARRFAIPFPGRVSYFNAQAGTLKEQIDAIEREFAPQFDALRRRRLLALSYQFDPLAARFKVELIHTVTSGANALSDSEVIRLREASRDELVKTVLAPADMPAAVAQDLAQRTGLRVVVLDAYGSSSATGRATYQELLRYDLEQLLNAAAGTNQ